MDTVFFYQKEMWWKLMFFSLSVWVGYPGHLGYPNEKLVQKTSSYIMVLNIE